MKYLITERQLKLIKEDEVKIKKINFDIFNNDWHILQKFLERRGNPPYILRGYVNLRGVDVVTLGSLVGVEEGYLDLSNNKTIKDLGSLEFVKGLLYIQNTNIESLGNLKSVGGYLFLGNTNIESLENLQSVGGFLNLNDSKIESLGNLKFVGGDLLLRNSPLSKKITKEEIRNQVEVGGSIYL